MSKIQVDEIVNSSGTGSPTFTFGAPGDLNIPLRLYATNPANSSLNIAPFEVPDSMGTGRAGPPQLNSVNTTQFTMVTTIDFQTGTVSPAANVSIGFPTTTSGQYRRVGFSYSAVTGIVTGTFSAASVTLGGLANVGSLFLANQRPLGWIDLQGTGGSGYKTAGSTAPKIENSVGGLIRVHNFSPASSTLAIQGTTDQILVSQSGSVVTLSAPQNIATISTPTFAGLFLNGQLSITTSQYTGGVTRTLSNPVTAWVGIQTYHDTFTNLSTTPWGIAGGSTANGILHFILTNVDGDSACFTIYGAVESGVLWRFGTSPAAAANCTIAEGAEGVFTVSGMGDGRTYTITCSTSSAAMTIAASTVTAGNTTLKIVRFT